MLEKEEGTCAARVKPASTGTFSAHDVVDCGLDSCLASGPLGLLADGGLGPVHGQVGVVLEAGHVGVVVLVGAVLLRFWL